MGKKCPFCNNDMTKGYIQSRDPLYWSEKIRKIAAIPPINNSILLAIPDETVFKGTSIEAYNCSKCKKIVISYDENSISD